MIEISERAMRAFKDDLVVYRDATGKQNNEVLATQALNFSIRYRKLLKDQAPKKETVEKEAASRGYKEYVRGSIREEIGAEDSYKGKFKRQLNGVIHRNKRSYAVRKEVNLRKKSVGWNAKSIAGWPKKKNKEIEENTAPNFGFARTKGGKQVVGRARGKFSTTRDFVKVRAMAFNIDRVDKSKGDLHELALRSAGNDMRKEAGKRYARKGVIIGKSIKRVYK